MSGLIPNPAIAQCLPPHGFIRLWVLLWLARQARRDPAAFAEFAFRDECGLPMQLGAVHRQLQQFLTDTPRALVELPRDHGKTVQVLIRVLWELGRNPNLRVVIVCGSGALATQRGLFLRNAISDNPLVRLVFPHLRPGRPWTMSAFRVQRDGNSVSPTVVVIGPGAAATGSRADLLVCDDMVDVKAMRSEAIRERVKIIFRENLVNLLEPSGRAWLLFTPWHAADLNAELKKSPVYRHFRRAIGDDLEPVWPEKWPRERLVDRRAEIGDSAFARAFRLRTIAVEDCVIRPQWIKFVDASLRDAIYDFIVLAVDPAVSQKRSADASALVTLGRTADGKIHCLEAIARRVAAPELVQLIDDAERRWQPHVILFEANAAFKGIKDLIVRHARFGSKVQEIHHSKDKFARITAFSVRVQNEAFFLRGEQGVVAPSQQELFDEMLAFPVGEHDDLLDAAAFGTAYLLDQREPRVW